MNGAKHLGAKSWARELAVTLIGISLLEVVVSFAHAQRGGVALGVVISICAIWAMLLSKTPEEPCECCDGDSETPMASAIYVAPLQQNTPNQCYQAPPPPPLPRQPLV